MTFPDSAVPYISIVAVARDGDAQDNLPAFAESWTSRAARLGLSSELIVVAAAPRQTSATVRLIEVPASVPETVARNAGIRRARGEFILSTDLAVVFSDELMQFLASRQLRKGCLYRLDMHQGSVVYAREGTFNLTPDGLRQNAAQDITAAGSDIHFGPGWFPAETDPAGGELFRWIENDAEVVLRVPEADGALSLELEPGPGAGPLPQIVRVLDSAGEQVAEWTVSGRACVRLWVPPAPRGGMQSFRLSIPDGGRPLIKDLRILNFRCFTCDWVRSKSPFPSGSAPGSMRPTLIRLIASQARSRGIARLLPNATALLRQAVRLLSALGDDVFGAGIEYWGQGWHRLEQAGAEKFRWVSTAAELVVRVGDRQQDLCLLVEPGPSLNGRPFQLEIRLPGGEVISKVPIDGLTPVRVPVPLAPGTVSALSLSPDIQGPPLPGDSRVLNFRVLACACEPSETTSPTARAAAGRGWTSVTVSQNPAAIDWPARLLPHRREIAEMGRPAFLHVNDCDFILMDRERWFDLRGFPEAEGAPEHLKALLCYTAHFAGAAEEVLREPMRIDRAFPSTRTPAPLDDDMVWLISQMRRLHVPAILNLDTWGLAAAALREAAPGLPALATGSEV